MTTTVDPRVASYLDQVKTFLSDLPEDERADLVDDLEANLLDVAAEYDGTLEERLGPPEMYAAELRASAGLAPFSNQAETRGLRAAIAGAAPLRAFRSMMQSDAARGLAGFADELRPGWWVLRAYVLAVALGLPGRGAYEAFPIPFAFGNKLTGIAAAIVALWVSVKLGRRAESGKRALSAVFTVVAVLAAGIALAERPPVAPVPATDSAFDIDDVTLQHGDGTSIVNLCPYGPDGKLLSGVLLFDQAGRPVTNTDDIAVARNGSFERLVRVERVGPAIPNEYPAKLEASDAYPLDPEEDRAPAIETLGACPLKVDTGRR